METLASAVHIQDQDNHAVVLGAIRVLVSERFGEWFSQGIEIDFAASGSSVEEVQRRFEDGLAATVDLHLRKFGSIDRLLKFAPQQELAKLRAEKYRFSMVTTHDMKPDLVDLPFGKIAYLQERDSHL